MTNLQQTPIAIRPEIEIGRDQVRFNFPIQQTFEQIIPLVEELLPRDGQRVEIIQVLNEEGEYSLRVRRDDGLDEEDFFED